mgnify:FL=1
MKLRKIISILLCAIFILSLMVGCGSKETVSEDGQKEDVQEETTQPETEDK